MPPQCVLVVGAQWGDEGKGKVVDLLAGGFDWIARYQGGHNAGHTVVVDGRRLVLQLIPCGVLRPNARALIGNGLVIDPQALVAEMDMIEAAGISLAGRLFVSNRAHVILPFHRMIEKAAENAPGRLRIGTTSRGIGPAYEDKMGRRGLRVADLANLDFLRAHIHESLAEKNAIAAALYGTPAMDAGAMVETCAALARRIAPLLVDGAELLDRAWRQGERILLEGAQGALLDIDHGTYPFVTSSSTTAGGAATGTGLAPTRIQAALGVAKAYATRVGGGPFPTEISGPLADELRQRGQEFGSVTGRARRIGWFDVPLLRYAAMVNGLDSLIVTKLDILDTLATIPVCVGYQSGAAISTSVPPTTAGWDALQPVYENLPGWRVSTAGIRRYADLPQAARDYLQFLAARSGVEIGMVSTGPERDQTIRIPGSRLDGMLGDGQAAHV